MDDIKIKPWDERQLKALKPIFEKIFDEFRRQQISFKKIFKAARKGDKINLEEIIMPFLQHAPEIFQITFGFEADQFRKMDPRAQWGLALLIYEANMKEWEHIINILFSKIPWMEA
jgi:hypothetical protein